MLEARLFLLQDCLFFLGYVTGKSEFPPALTRGEEKANASETEGLWRPLWRVSEGCWVMVKTEDEQVYYMPLVMWSVRVDRRKKRKKKRQ